MAKKKFYAVAVGRRTGIYTAWEGEGGAAAQVTGLPDARYKGFTSLEDAQQWLAGSHRTQKPTYPPPGIVWLYSDGSCITNPGPGGYGVVILDGHKRIELSGGFKLTTNNRMEILACISGLKALRGRQVVEIYTDSSYVVNSMVKGWAVRWQANDWMRTAQKKAENADLWEQLLNLCQQHSVSFNWLPGHAGHPENERCDRLAMKAATQPDLPPDPGFMNR